MERRRALRRRPLPSRCAGARERRGTACTDFLPANSSTFPVKGCSSGRESGSLRLPGGQRLAVGRVWGAGGRCDVDRCHPATRARTSGEEQLVPTPSRILFHLSRLMIAVSAANPTRCGCPAGRRLPVGRVWAPEGAATSTAASPLRGRSRAARSSLYRPPPG